ncbi:hypothetical protein [Erythrobacter sp. MTPC3]|uniref:hypothetical protein n=1 Tax=Erythrobacter sp. MTPC3 TaxID=3056564 RepID=UPI0036F367C4
MRAFLGMMLLISLSACGGEASENMPDESQAAQDGTEKPMPVEPDGGIGDGAGPIPGTEDGDAPQADLIPARFHGIWDYEGGTCALESDMRMEISASEIMFYESLGIVSGTRMEGEDVVVTLNMEGEGETWQQATRLSLVGEGEELRLHASDGETPKEIDEYPAKKCPPTGDPA